MADSFHIQIITKTAYQTQEVLVYNCEVEGDHSYVANGFAVHNCPMCTDLNGEIHPLDDDMVSHPRCRCSPAPYTKSWDDILSPLGMSADDLGLEDTSLDVESGSDWFARQDEATQRAVLGPSAFNAYQQGDLKLSDLVGRNPDGSYYQKSLKEAGLNFRDYLPTSSAAKSVESDLEGFALKEPTALTREELAGKSMAELRQMAREMGVTAARTKDETIERILAKSQGGAATKAAASKVTATPEKLKALRSKLDEEMAQREALYAQQSELVAEQDRLENTLNHPEWTLDAAEHQAKIDLYHQSLDASDPNVKQYFKDLATQEKARGEVAAARAEQERLVQEMQTLAFQGKKGSAEYAEAKAEYDAAVAKEAKAEKAAERARQNLWTKSPGVYKPELDSIGGFDLRTNPIVGYDKNFKPIRKSLFTKEQVEQHPLMVAARERLATAKTRITEIKSEVSALDKPIKQINTQIKRDLTRLKKMATELKTEDIALDTMRPFSDVIALPEGHQPDNALMRKLDSKMHEPREVTKSRIIDNIHQRLKDNPAWQEYVERAPRPHLGKTYHAYVGDYATAKDTKSAQLVADWVKKWGVGYKPGSPEWVAMQRAVNEEFGLDAAIHTTEQALRDGEAFYAENGEAVRALMRAMYDNTQQWFAEQGITEVELYRGMGWEEHLPGSYPKGFDKSGKPIGLEPNPLVPKGITWGPLDKQNYGVADMELNPFQSFSADINISQGTTAKALGFAGGGFGGGSDYSLLIGAKIPVERILSTAQTGFGAKLESEVVVMGRATDTVAYRAGTRVESALMRQADEESVRAGEMVYTLADGTAVRVAANLDGTFTMTYEDGPNGKLGSFKLGASKTYKTEQGVNKALDSMHIANTYVAPDLTELSVKEGETEAEAALSAGERDLLAARIDSITADVTSVPDIQDWLQQQIPGLNVASPGGLPGRVDLMALDPQAARLIANAIANPLSVLPGVSDNLWRIEATRTYTDALAFVPRDGFSLILNTDKFADLAGIAERAPQWAAQGWWVGETPEEIIGHEVGHLVQLNYKISNDTWVEAMDRVAAAGGNPLVSTYAGNKIEESFAETFALLVYGDPTDEQLPIVREMAAILKENGIDYNDLRAAVGASPANWIAGT